MTQILTQILIQTRTLTLTLTLNLTLTLTLKLPLKLSYPLTWPIRVSEDAQDEEVEDIGPPPKGHRWKKVTLTRRDALMARVLAEKNETRVCNSNIELYPKP